MFSKFHPLRDHELVLATHNAGKIKEIAPHLQAAGVGFKTSSELGLEEPVEDQTSCLGNAILKAVAASKSSGLTALADDSGLFVDALDGAPGVYTADWCTDADGIRRTTLGLHLIRSELAKRGHDGPVTASMRTTLVIASCLTGQIEYFEGRIDGILHFDCRGSDGFGFDPYFQPEHDARRFAEMTPGEKLGKSHRQRAIQTFLNICVEGLSPTAYGSSFGRISTGDLSPVLAAQT